MKRLLVITICIFKGIGAFAQVADTTMWAPNGPVNAIFLKDSLLFVGGDFDQVSPVTGNFVLIDSTIGTVSTPFPTVIGKINCMVKDSAGYVYVGGSFGKVGNHDCFNLFRLTPQGDFDPSFAPNPDGEVFDLMIAWHTLFVGGNFITFDGWQRGKGAAIYLPNDSLTPFNPECTGTIYAFCADTLGFSVIVGGDFMYLGTTNVAYIAKLNRDNGIAAHNGNLPWTAVPQVFGPVKAIAIENQKIYVGGDFNSFATINYKGLGIIKLFSGALLTQYNASLNGYVSDIDIINNTVYISGDFTSSHSMSRQRLASLDTALNLLAWNPIANGVVKCIEPSKDSSAIYVAGSFHFLGGDTIYNAGMILLDSIGTVVNWNPKFNAAASAIIPATTTGKIWVGGDFSGAGGVLRENLCAININSKTANNWNPKVNYPVTTLFADDSQLFVSGDFVVIDNQPRNRIASFDLSGLALTSFNPGVNGLVRTMVSDNVNLFLGGNFTLIGGQNRNNIASITIANAATTVWNPGCAGTVNKILLDGNHVYVGGFFTQCGSVMHDNLARLNKSTGLSDWSWSCDTDDGIYDLDLYNGQLYIGGWFLNVAGQGRNYMAAVDTFSGNLLPFNHSFENYIHGFARWNDDLFIAGDFNLVNGNLMRPHLCNFDLGDGVFDGWAPSPNIFPETMFASQNQLYVGGSFSTIGYRYHPNLCLLNIMWLTGIPSEQQMPLQIKVWPNPTSDFVFIEVPFNFENHAVIQIIDIDGKIIREENWVTGSSIHEMDVRELPAGIYSLRLIANDGEEASCRIVRN